jgi:hypothetical protein
VVSLATKKKEDTDNMKELALTFNKDSTQDLLESIRYAYKNTQGGKVSQQFRGNASSTPRQYRRREVFLREGKLLPCDFGGSSETNHCGQERHQGLLSAHYNELLLKKCQWLLVSHALSPPSSSETFF